MSQFPRIAIATTMLCQPLYAQSSPVDLTELSLVELMSIEVLSIDVESDAVASDGVASDVVSIAPGPGSSWSFRYRYVHRRFDGYRDGTNRLSHEDVLFRPGETRTDKNFPVVPTEIMQEAHIAEISYLAMDRWTLSLVLPYIRQSTDHISSVPGYDDFNITTQGLGDISLTGVYTLQANSEQSWTMSTGISFPTGSIDEKGDTPRSPGDQQLPYTMQLGSGTWDISAGLTHTRHVGTNRSETPLEWGVVGLGTARLGRNDREYSLGNRMFASTWIANRSWGRLSPSLRLNAQVWGSIDGQDDEITVPGAFPYPAAVTNPALFGGEKLDLVFGVEVLPANPGDWISGQSLRLELGGPVYQSLNGPQPGATWSFGLVWSPNF